MPEHKTYDDGDECPYCGAVQAGTDEDPAYVYTCPLCEREGCSECMPAGRGVPCPECEEVQGDDD
ncbi:MAG: hypothetical protein FJ098_04550 [Deltaproteobacteria bacterium]|nr:hypothetical protein [Deltaproteobacteria bacterium]